MVEFEIYHLIRLCDETATRKNHRRPYFAVLGSILLCFDNFYTQTFYENEFGSKTEKKQYATGKKILNSDVKLFQ